MKLAEITAALAAAGAKTPHVRLVLTAWLAGRDLEWKRSERRHPHPASLIAALPRLAETLDAIATTVSTHAGEDGSLRMLLRLRDGKTVESVLLPRQGLCVSTQVGCAVGCVFCWTGRDGLLRNLTGGEILAQVALARRRRTVRRVVLMGMGEPSQNFQAAMEAITALGTLGGIGHKDLVFSTVGDRRLFDRLRRGEVKPAIALSLHSTDPELRARLLPRAPRIAPEELVALADDYARAVTYPIQVQWTLIEGVNDGPDEFARLADLLRGRHAIVNLIPCNPVDGLGFRRPPAEKARALVRTLRSRGVLATIRHSAGQDVEGACGQLRARAAPVT